MGEATIERCGFDIFLQNPVPQRHMGPNIGQHILFKSGLPIPTQAVKGYTGWIHLGWICRIYCIQTLLYQGGSRVFSVSVTILESLRRCH